MTNENNVLDENAPADINPIEQTENEPAVELLKAEENTADPEKEELKAKLEVLEAELLKERIKVKLLVLGILPEKLEDGAAMAYGLCLAGKSPETAASEIIEAYPHLKAVRQELPQFSAESAGSKDGFSAIRRIFSAR
ncbi:MAG: hypothetical protein K2J80_10115 [Oscillospiraceae bacterium]|nr:hypothetical protein [Oscillospiraceae bacterium]